VKIGLVNIIFQYNIYFQQLLKKYNLMKIFPPMDSNLAGLSEFSNCLFPKELSPG